jgi:hypothetical protein
MIRTSDDDNEWNRRLELFDFLVEKGALDLSGPQKAEDRKYVGQIETLRSDIQKKASYYLDTPVSDEPEEAQYWKDLSTRLLENQSGSRNELRNESPNEGKTKRFKIAKVIFQRLFR